MHLGDSVSISCTVETQADCSTVGASLRRIEGEATINDVNVVIPINTDGRCTYNFTAEVTGGYVSLHCGLAHTLEANCVSEQQLHLLVSPVLDQVSTVSSLQSYRCTLPCIYETAVLYVATEHIYRNIGNIRDPDLLERKNATSSECGTDGFKMTGIDLDVSVSYYTELLPNLICGGHNPWTRILIYSELLNRTSLYPSEPTPSPTNSDTTVTVTTDNIITTTVSASVRNTCVYSVLIFCLILISL